MNIENISDLKPVSSHPSFKPPHDFLIELARAIRKNPSSALFSVFPAFTATVLEKSPDEIALAGEKLEKAINGIPFLQKAGTLPGFFAKNYPDTKDKEYKLLAHALAQGDGPSACRFIYKIVKKRVGKAKEGSAWDRLAYWLEEEMSEAREIVKQGNIDHENPLALYLATSFKKISGILTSPFWKPILKLACRNYRLAPQKVKRMIAKSCHKLIRIIVEKEGDETLHQYGEHLGEALYQTVDQFLLSSRHIGVYFSFITLASQKVHGSQDVEQKKMKREILTFIWHIIDDLEAMEKFGKGIEAAASKVVEIPK